MGKGTFATLDQYNTLVADVAGIKVNVEKVNAGIAELEKRLNEEMEANIDAAAREITEAYSAAVSTAKEELTSAYEAALSAAVDDLETSMKAWVNELLTGYYTIAQIDAKIAALSSSTLEENSTLKEEIDNLKASLETAKEELTEAYQQAILAAINENNGVINTQIVTEIATVNGRIDKEIETLNSKIAAIEVRLKNIEDILNSNSASINTINEQIAAINTTLANLDNADAALEAIIDLLESENSGHHTSINQEITDLKNKKNEIENAIAELRQYVDDELKDATDWVSATFATLEQYNTLAATTAGLDEKLKETIENLDKVKNGTEANTAAIETIIAQVERLEASITALETSMKAWVNEQLAGYYTIAQIDAKITELQNSISAGDNELGEDIENLTASLEQATETLTEGYQSAIEAAINENNGVIDSNLQTAITNINNRINQEVQALNQKIATIEERLDSIEQDVEKLLKRIQSISFIPQYSDGKAYIESLEGYNTSHVEFNFMVSPKEAVTDIKEVWSESVSMKAVQTIAKAINFIEMPIISFEADETNGIITISASGENLYNDLFVLKGSASAVLLISDGSNQIASEYIPLGTVTIDVEPYTIEYTTTDNTKLSSVAILDDPNLLYHTFEGNTGKLIFKTTNMTIPEGAFHNNVFRNPKQPKLFRNNQI